MTESLVAAEQVGISPSSGVARFATSDVVNLTLASPGNLYVYVNADLWNPVDQFQVRLLIDGTIRMSWLAGPSAVPLTYKLVDVGGGSIQVQAVAQQSGLRPLGAPFVWAVAAGAHTVELVYVSFSGAPTAAAARGANRRLTVDSVALADPTISDPTLHYGFEEGAGTAVADGGSGDRDSSLIGSAAWVAGKVGAKAIGFPGGAGDGVLVDSSYYVVGAVYTYAFWVDFDSAEGIISGRENGVYSLFYDGTDFYHSASQGIYVNQAHGLTLPTPGWVHIAVARLDQAVQFYLNGAPLGSGKTLSANDAHKHKRICGIESGSFAAAFKIDDFRIYNRVLRPSEVAALHALGSAPAAPAARRLRMLV